MKVIDNVTPKEKRNFWESCNNPRVNRTPQKHCNANRKRKTTPDQMEPLKSWRNTPLVKSKKQIANKTTFATACQPFSKPSYNVPIYTRFSKADCLYLLRFKSATYGMNSVTNICINLHNICIRLNSVSLSINVTNASMIMELNNTLSFAPPLPSFN